MTENEKKKTHLPASRPESGLSVRGRQTPASDVISDLKCRELIRAAREMLKYSYVPYSHFHVGAALMTKAGKIYRGCNIENASYGATNCAERTAFFKAVSEGEREFLAIAIVGGHEGRVEDFCPPCGICRQVMAEFCDLDNFYVILSRSEEDYWVYPLSEILPMAFTPHDLEV
ncbi:MAG: cytidine deaminase [Lachnospiraceae bacterium]|nr:cytidine deaminase [Lachnospiraceae bacterium]